MEPSQFLNNLATNKPSAPERAVALLWFLTDHCELEAVTSNEICKIIEESGFGKQNNTRTKDALNRDRKIVKHNKTGYRVHPNHMETMRGKYFPLIGTKPVPKSDSVLPHELFKAAHGYTIKVADQLNAAYEYSLFDCCAVMCRRLLETLIIESYETAGQVDDLKTADGNFMMFSGLLSAIEKNNQLGMSRNCIKALKDFKKLGDLSAHNRRFNARKNDVDRIRDDIRIACEELLHLCKQAA